MLELKSSIRRIVYGLSSMDPQEITDFHKQVYELGRKMNQVDIKLEGLKCEPMLTLSYGFDDNHIKDLSKAVDNGAPIDADLYQLWMTRMDELIKFGDVARQRDADEAGRLAAKKKRADAIRAKFRVPKPTDPIFSTDALLPKTLLSPNAFLALAGVTGAIAENLSAEAPYHEIFQEGAGCYIDQNNQTCLLTNGYTPMIESLQQMFVAIDCDNIKVLHFRNPVPEPEEVYVDNPEETDEQVQKRLKDQQEQQQKMPRMKRPIVIMVRVPPRKYQPASPL